MVGRKPAPIGAPAAVGGSIGNGSILLARLTISAAPIVAS